MLYTMDLKPLTSLLNMLAVNTHTLKLHLIIDFNLIKKIVSPLQIDTYFMILLAGSLGT